jgi:hypothetical protein
MYCIAETARLSRRHLKHAAPTVHELSLPSEAPALLFFLHCFGPMVSPSPFYIFCASAKRICFPSTRNGINMLPLTPATTTAKTERIQFESTRPRASDALSSHTSVANAVSRRYGLDPSSLLHCSATLNIEGNLGSCLLAESSLLRVLGLRVLGERVSTKWWNKKS